MSFGSQIVPLLNICNDKFENDTNAGLGLGTAALLFELDDLADGADDPYVPGKLFLLEKTPEKAPPAWDVTDQRAVLPRSLSGGDLKTALAGMDEIYEQAAEARRSLKAATSGRKAPAARPGALRDKVLAHLDAHPDGEFTPHEIHKVLNHSSGAIANALDVLVKLREAELATEKPHRYRRSAQPTTPAAETDGTGGAQDDSAELAGAA